MNAVVAMQPAVAGRRSAEWSPVKGGTQFLKGVVDGARVKIVVRNSAAALTFTRSGDAGPSLFIRRAFASAQAARDHAERLATRYGLWGTQA